MAGIYRMAIIANRPDGLILVTNLNDASRTAVDSLNIALEPDFIYPYLRGRDVIKWGSNVETYILVPQLPERPSKGVPEDKLIAKFPRTHEYVHHFFQQLNERAVYQKLLAPSGEPFYAMYNVGDYTFSPYKVVWKYVASSLKCSVISSRKDEWLGEKVIVPDSKLVLVPFGSEAEAHYVCSLLNNSISAYIVACYAVTTQISTHVVEYVSIPKYDPDNELHSQLSNLSIKTHDAVVHNLPTTDLEAEIDRLAARLWGLTDLELKEIQDSLAELG
jgi:hypothetical protein